MLDRLIGLTLGASLMLALWAPARAQSEAPEKLTPDRVAALAKEAKPDEEAEPFPITVQVEPELVLILDKEGSKGSRKVTIRGETLPVGDKPVKIIIEADELPPVHADVVPDESGRFEFSEYAPLDAGEYEITAIAPDGRGEAKTELIAVEADELAETAGEAMQETAQATEEALEVTARQLAELPPSPAKEEAEQKLEEARGAARELSGKSKEAAASFKELVDAINSEPAWRQKAEPELQQATDDVRDLRKETERVRLLTSGMSKADLGCHQLATITEVFKAISAALNIKRKLLEVGLGLAKDIAADAVTNASDKSGRGPVAGFLSGQLVKNAESLGSASKLAGNVYGFMADLGGFISQQAFSHYCEQFVGPVNATMEAKFFLPDKPGSPMWWSYDFKLAGRLVLYYPKNAKGSVTRLKGRIEGVAHSFNTWEDALRITFPTIMAGAMEYKKHIPPFDLGAVAAQAMTQGAGAVSAQVEGSVAGALTPNSFVIDVEGVLEEDSISLLIGKAITDFTAKHRVTALILSPLTGGLGPQLTWYELPFKDAHHVIDRSSNGEAIKLPLKNSGKVMTAEGNFNATSGGERAKGSYRLSLKACNPGC
jgi:hypothetical protein